MKSTTFRYRGKPYKVFDEGSGDVSIETAPAEGRGKSVMPSDAMLKAARDALVKAAKTYAISKDELDAELSRILGRPVSGYVSQSMTEYRYGYARVSVPGPGSSVGNVSRATGRKEGDPGGVGQHPRVFDLPEQDTLRGLAEWIADILRTGRTVECGKGVGLREWANKINVMGRSCNESLDMLIEGIDAHLGGTIPEWGQRYNLAPDYQRGYVWTDRQASLFVGHWLEGGEIGRILVQRYESQKNVPSGTKWHELPVEVIDGQQRLRSIWRWVKGEIDAEISDGKRWAYKDTNEIDRFDLNVVLTYVDLPRAERLRLYIRLNRGGTVHADDEIERVRALLAEESKDV